jgi:hypothetical protein
LATAAGTAIGRLSWEQAHRLEVTLRARSSRFGGKRSTGCCAGCGREVAPDDDQLRLAGTVVHTGCLQEATLA